ncbi:LysR family transcriptional regulator [Pelagibius sp. Alg239-R121]|uniref:LysR family transcriptional regulator n=1 Tax=Pelagibius sp. Alg239-R121 TaxID=2993448 RepID=UPI0024A660E4|nr:LysR family transcriptional regulator [Pelagibius sp. Alg239-R121]
MDTKLKHHLNLNWLRSFEAVARLSGFTAASRELGLTQTAVSLHIKALETQLGHDLFIRRAKSLQLTEIGKAYLPSVRDALEALTLSTNGLFGPDLKSTVIVRASMAAVMWLAPRLGDFRQRHPNIGIKLVTSIWADSPDTQNVDVDITLAPDNRAAGVSEKLSDEYLVPICSVSAAKAIQSVEDLSKTNPIHILGFDDHWSRYMAAFGLQHDVNATRLMVDTSVAACELVAADLGSAVVIERFAMNAIEAGRPVALVGDRIPLGQSHYLVERGGAKKIHPAAEVFKDWLRVLFHANPQ